MKGKMLEELEYRYIGKKVFVHIEEKPDQKCFVGIGIVEDVDSGGCLHGTWGDWAALPKEVEIL